MRKEDLKVGDRIRLLHVPPKDLEDRAKPGCDPAFPSTATVLEYLLAHDPIQTIDQIDESGQPWFSAVFIWDGDRQNHAIAIMEDESWELNINKFR